MIHGSKFSLEICNFACFLLRRGLVRGLFGLLRRGFACITTVTLALDLPQHSNVSRINNLGGGGGGSLPVGRGGQLFCSDLQKNYHRSHMLSSTQGSLPWSFSWQRAHLACESNRAIMWPHVPLFCPEDAMILQKPKY